MKLIEKTPSYESQYTEILTYGTEVNKLNINFFGDIDVFIQFKGIEPKNYQTGITTSSGSTYTFSYTFNSDGYPSVILLTTKNSGGATYDSNRYTFTYY